jgi:hypothetical protein
MLLLFWQISALDLEYINVKFYFISSLFWFSLQFLFETFLISSSTERDVIKMYNGLHMKYPIFWSDFNETCILWTELKKTQM